MRLFEQHALSCHFEPRLKRKDDVLIQDHLNQDHLNVALKLEQGVESLSHHQTA